MRVVIVAELLPVSKSVSLALTVSCIDDRSWRGRGDDDGDDGGGSDGQIPKAQFTGQCRCMSLETAVAETKFTPEGRVSVTLTFVAEAGPLLVTVMR